MGVSGALAYTIHSITHTLQGCSTAPLEGWSPSGIAAVEAVLIHTYGQTDIHMDRQTHSVKCWSGRQRSKNEK